MNEEPDGIPQIYPGLRGVSLMRRDELQALIALVPADGQFLEMGTSDGVTAAMIAKARPHALIVSLDTYDYEPDRLLNWRANKQPNQHLWVGDPDSFYDFGESRFDVVLVDTSHDEETVSRDLIHAYAAADENGIIAVHDYGDPNWPGVKAAVDLFVTQGNYKIGRRTAHLIVLFSESKQ